MRVACVAIWVLKFIDKVKARFRRRSDFSKNRTESSIIQNQVVMSAIEEEDRSKNLNIFGLEESDQEKINIILGVGRETAFFSWQNRKKKWWQRGQSCSTSEGASL